MNVFDNIAYGLVERGVGKVERGRKVREMAELLRIPHLLDRRISTLSGGEQQRVAFARAVVLDCRLLLLDEPPGALDWVTKQGIGACPHEIHNRFGLTVLHVTHDFPEALGLANRVGVIHEGRLLQVGAIEEVFTKPTSRTVTSFVGMPNLWPANNGHFRGCPLIEQLRKHVASPQTGEVWLSVRPEHIVIGRSECSTCDVSSQGTVQSVRWRGAFYDVVDVGAPVVVSVGICDFRKLGCSMGDAVWVGLDPEKVHVVTDA